MAGCCRLLARCGTGVGAAHPWGAPAGRCRGVPHPTSHLSIPPPLSCRGPARTRASSSRSWPRGTTRRSRLSTRRTSRVRHGGSTGSTEGHPQTHPVVWWAVDPQPGCSSQLSPPPVHSLPQAPGGRPELRHLGPFQEDSRLPGSGTGGSPAGGGPLRAAGGIWGTRFGEGRARGHLVGGTSQMSSPWFLYPTTGQPR